MAGNFFDQFDGPQQVVPQNPIAVRKAQGDIAGQDVQTARTRQGIGIDAANNRREDVKLQADLAKNGLRLTPQGTVEPIPNWKPTGEQASVRMGQLRDRISAMQNLEASLNNVQSLYNRDFKGQPASRLGGLSEFVPGAFNQRNQQFNSAAQRLGPFIQSILGLSGKEADAAAEYERKVMPFIPRAADYDSTNEDKLRQLRDFLNTQRANTHRELGLPLPGGAGVSSRKSAPNRIRYDERGNRIK